MSNFGLDDRMKRYESVSRTYLTRRVPVIIRIDGKAFHTFTRGFFKPFDDVLTVAMQYTMKDLCENIQGCVFGYTQSDEITLVLTDYATLTTDAWFDYNVQKLCSIAASMATLYFNKSFKEEAVSWSYRNFREDIYDKALSKGAMFDARAFTIPKEEVCNCLIWRQQDAIRNSIEATGQAYFSHKQLHNKTCAQIKEMLKSDCDFDWNEFALYLQRGSACYKIQGENEVHAKWFIDKNIPLFTQDRDFVERHVLINEA